MIVTKISYFVFLNYEKKKTFSEMSPTKISGITKGDNSKNLSDTHDLLTSVKPCPLPEDVQKIAFRELREDENARKQCLSGFRQWICQNQDVQNINIGMINNDYIS